MLTEIPKNEKEKKKNTTTSLFADDSNEGETPSSSQGSHSPVIGTSGSTSEGSDSDEFGAEPVLMPSQYSMANQESLPRKFIIVSQFFVHMICKQQIDRKAFVEDSKKGRIVS